MVTHVCFSVWGSSPTALRTFVLSVGGVYLLGLLTLGLAVWCASAKACAQCEGCHVWAKAWELLFQIQPPNRRHRGWAPGCSRSVANLWSLRDMKKKSLFIVVSSWEWEDHYFIEADWFKLLVQKEICKELMTECLWEKILLWFWSDFLKILVVKPREREMHKHLIFISNILSPKQNPWS